MRPPPLKKKKKKKRKQQKTDLQVENLILVMLGMFKIFSNTIQIKFMWDPGWLFIHCIQLSTMWQHLPTLFSFVRRKYSRQQNHVGNWKSKYWIFNFLIWWWYYNNNLDGSEKSLKSLKSFYMPRLKKLKLYGWVVNIFLITNYVRKLNYNIDNLL